MFKIIIKTLQKNVPDFLRLNCQFSPKNRQEKNHCDRVDDDEEDRFEDFDERERIW